MVIAQREFTVPEFVDDVLGSAQRGPVEAAIVRGIGAQYPLRPTAAAVTRWRNHEQNVETISIDERWRPRAC